jgi:hypothetical protein
VRVSLAILFVWLLILIHHCCPSIRHSSVSLLRPSILAAMSRPLHAQHTPFKAAPTPLGQARKWSGVPHGRVRASELTLKDGRTHYPFAGHLRNIQEDIQYHKHQKWGFLIYRCDYASDELWNKFLSNLQTMLDFSLTLPVYKAENLREPLEMTLIDDNEKLDGASIEQVRDIFTEWVRSDEARLEMGEGAPCGAFTYPRYTYCVHVDADVLDSTVNRAPQPPEHDDRQIAYVNLLQLRFEDFAEGMTHMQCFIHNFRRTVGDSIEDDDDDSEWDDIEEDEDVVKVPLSYLGPESYDNLYDHFVWERYFKYRREDDVSYGSGALNPHDFYPK